MRNYRRRVLGCWRLLRTGPEVRNLSFAEDAACARDACNTSGLKELRG